MKNNLTQRDLELAMSEACEGHRISVCLSAACAVLARAGVTSGMDYDSLMRLVCDAVHTMYIANGGIMRIVPDEREALH